MSHHWMATWRYNWVAKAFLIYFDQFHPSISICVAYVCSNNNAKRGRKLEVSRSSTIILLLLLPSPLFLLFILFSSVVVFFFWPFRFQCCYCSGCAYLGMQQDFEEAIDPKEKRLHGWILFDRLDFRLWKLERLKNDSQLPRMLPVPRFEHNYCAYVCMFSSNPT